MARFNPGTVNISGAVDRFMGAKKDAQTRQLMGPAAAGNPEALQALYSVNPEAGMMVQKQIESTRLREQQLAQQQDRTLDPTVRTREL